MVVDIPDLTHSGFDYSIPAALLSTVKKGSRVIVPLGSRTTQGFVIAIHDKTKISNKIKAIKDNLDVVPSLSEELIQLAIWMSNRYSTHLFRTLQILIPSALKTKVEQVFIVEDDIDITVLSIQLSQQEINILAWVLDKQPVQESSLLKRFPNEHMLIQRLVEDGHLQLKKDFKDKGTKKKISVLKKKLAHELLSMELDKLPKNAQKQKLIIEYILFNAIEEIEIPKLMTALDITHSSIQALVKKGYIEVVEKEQLRDPYQDRFFQDKKVMLTNEQEKVFEQIVDAYHTTTSKPFLLHGVTGSGKTEIYLQAIQYGLDQGKDSIVLVPEISLTPQMVERFKGRFGSLVAVLHSRLSQGERLDEWRRIQRGKAKIVIGARSAIFAPLKNISFIIIDEEHESSYKQEEHPKYHTRDIAIWRAAYHQSIVVLGSATPSLESYYLAQKKEYQLLELPNRVHGRSMPTIHVADMRDELRAGNRSMFSRTLQQMIEDRLNKKEQIVLLLNRRGFSTFVMCRTCGYVMKCPHCDISLTYHHTNNTLRCHYCGYEEQVPNVCPECGSEHIRYFGTGTQRVEEDLAKRFPGVRVIRMDVDTTSKKGSHEKLLHSFRKEEADILLGTQMIAKGLDYPKVTLVGVIAADTLLKLPDFRAAERTFQLLTQVSGRAGRHELLGDVVIQTYTPEHYSIEYTKEHDYHSFFYKELQNRRMLNYPPLSKLIIIHFTHEHLPGVMKASEQFVRSLKQLITSDTEVLGPVVSPISRLKDRYRFQCMVKYNDETNILLQIHQTISWVNSQLNDRQLQISVDVDPYVLM